MTPASAHLPLTSRRNKTVRTPSPLHHAAEDTWSSGRCASLCARELCPREQRPRIKIAAGRVPQEICVPSPRRPPQPPPPPRRADPGVWVRPTLGQPSSVFPRLLPPHSVSEEQAASTQLFLITRQRLHDAHLPGLDVWTLDGYVCKPVRHACQPGFGRFAALPVGQMTRTCSAYLAGRQGCCM